MNPARALFATFGLIVFLPLASAASIATIGPENRFPLQGKEVDWIDGDFVIANDLVVAVIAKPGPVRDANMTVRGVGACLIDLTRRDVQSDQLSCYYPAAGRFQFRDPALVESGELSDGGVFWRCQSSASTAADGALATIEYQLRDGQPFITVVVKVQGVQADDFPAFDGIRADGTFRFAALAGKAVGYCEDEHFRQTYGFQAIGSTATPKWNGNRLREIRYANHSRQDDGQAGWSVRVYPASSPVDLWGLTNGAAPQTFLVTQAVGDQPRIKLSIVDGDLEPLSLPASWRSAADGKSIVHLPLGTYRVRADAIGHQPVEAEIRVSDQAATHALKLGAASRVVAKITDDQGNPIPCKVAFYGAESADGQTTDDPQFGLDSQSGSVRNCVYSADGQFVRSIPPGSYEVMISRGPEYDALLNKIEVKAGAKTQLAGKLVRVVDTSGWVSAELHSHSSPSGDNTSDQLGRVENLICGHLEFAPCTEHQRIESYDDQLEVLGASRYMATCTGMELTGSLLPINHQNAFPLKHSPFAQDAWLHGYHRSPSSRAYLFERRTNGGSG